jgi:hypothetical protein
MGFTLSVPDKQYRLDSEAALGPQVPEAPSLFQGTGTAVGTSVVGGLAATARTVDDTVLTLGKAGIQSDLDQSMFWANDPTGVLARTAAEQSQAMSSAKSPLAAPIQAVQEWAKADPSTQGGGARTLGGAARGLTIIGTGSLFGGPVAGAGTLASVEGYNTYRDVQEGDTPVNQPTALKLAGLTAAANFAGAFLPLKLGSGAAKGLMGLGMEAEVAGNKALAASYYGAARTAATVTTNPLARLSTAATANVGFGAADRYATSAVLVDAGYKDMAAQYEPLDAQALASDFVMGLAFGAHAEIAPTVEAMKDRVMNGAAPPVDSRPPPSIIDAALATRREEMLRRNGAGVPTGPMHANLDADLQDEALQNLLRGRDVNVSSEDARTITEGALPDPARGAINDEFIGAMESQHGLLADFSEPVRQELPQPTKEMPSPLMADDPVAGSGGPAVSSLAAESLRQMVGRYPDMPVELGNGTSVRMADLPDVLAREMQQATKDAKLHEVAMACFLSTR